MAANTPNRPSGRKRKWFARRQVYLRTGQESQYVEISPALQIGVALGFGALALWLIGASYGAISGSFSEHEQTALLAKLDDAEQARADLEQERDSALQDVAKMADLETALAEAKARADDVSKQDQTAALTAELDQTRDQLEELHQRLSESKADQAALQARLEAEASATTDIEAKTAEEAASLHAQLEEAFNEIESLKERENTTSAKMAALTEEKAAKQEAVDRNTALLKSATIEIERLQAMLTNAETDKAASLDEHQQQATQLQGQLAETESERDEFELRAEDLAAQLKEAEAAALEKTANLDEYQQQVTQLQEQLAKTESERDEFELRVEDLAAQLKDAEAAALELAENADAPAIDAAADSPYRAQSIAADSREADLLATIEDLRAEIAAGDAEDLEDDAADTEELAALRERVTLAESEVERLILSGLTNTANPAEDPSPAAAEEEGSEETDRLRAELLTAQADIIKLNADVKAAKLRLAEQAEAQNGSTSRSDDSAKLKQQLASSRSQVQQLNKALADAKLREVAIDLALINVIPTPSPPAPR